MSENYNDDEIIDSSEDTEKKEKQNPKKILFFSAAEPESKGRSDDRTSKITYMSAQNCMQKEL